MNHQNKTSLLLIFLLILLSLIGIFSFFHSGFFPSHDGEWMVVRFSDFHRSLADGQFPVRWAGRLNFDYGYPVFNFLYPGTFYFTEIFHLLKFNFVDSVKASFVASYILSGIFMFLLGKKLWGKAGGLVAAVVYLYTPYRFVDMYVRGSLGESVAFIFPPLILYFWIKFQENKKNKIIWAVLMSFSLGALILAHNVIAYLFIPVLFCFTLVQLKNILNLKKKLLIIFLLFSTGILLTTFFWLPALWDKQFTVFDQVTIADYSKNFPSIQEMVVPSWNYGPSRPGNIDSMSFQVGVVNWLAVLVSLILIMKRKIKSSREKIAAFFLVVYAIAFFCINQQSSVIWQIIPGLSIIQFPWRILSVTTFSSAALGGFLISKLSGNKKMISALIIILLAIILNFSYTKPQSYVNHEEGYYYTNDDTTTVQNEYLPKWAKNLGKSRKPSKIEIVEGKGEITNQQSKSNALSFEYNGRRAKLIINIAYFPGWKISVNNTEVSPRITNEGLQEIFVSDGKSVVRMIFTETPLRFVADLVSLTTLGVLLLLFINSILISKK